MSVEMLVFLHIARTQMLSISTYMAHLYGYCTHIYPILLVFVSVAIFFDYFTLIFFFAEHWAMDGVVKLIWFKDHVHIETIAEYFITPPPGSRYFVGIQKLDYVHIVYYTLLLRFIDDVEHLIWNTGLFWRYVISLHGHSNMAY